MKKWIGTLLFIFLIPCVHAQTAMTQWLMEAGRCPDMTCTNEQIDRIDAQIAALLGQRLAYAKRMSELRKTVFGARDNQTMRAVYFSQNQAIQLGYSPSIARNVFNMIVLQTNYFISGRIY